jgi:hypothetical protein
MINIVVELSKYVILTLMIVYTVLCYYLVVGKHASDRKGLLRSQITLTFFLDFTAFVVIFLKTFDFKVVIFYAEMMIYFAAILILYRRIYKNASMLLLNNMCMLLSVGFIMLCRLDIASANKQLLIVACGSAVALVIPVMIRKMKFLKDLTWVYAGLGIVLLGAVLFAVVPLSMGILGFMGAGAGYQAQNLGIINFELIRHFFPSWAVLPFLFMIVSGLLSTVDSNLCAVSSLTTDIAGGKDIRKTRAAMAVLLITGILIANIPGITVTHLFLFYGTLRASTLLPTVMTLKGVRLNAKGIITGVVAALAVGLPVFAYGSVLNSGPYKTLGSLLTVLLSGLIALTASGKERRYAR